jgi:DNA ligase-1
MNLIDRVNAFEILFENLQLSNSRIYKDECVRVFNHEYPELHDDWIYILETLDGKHPIGWTFTPRWRDVNTSREPMEYISGIYSIKDMIKFCENVPDRTVATTTGVELLLGYYGEFLAPIVNRTLRLGIGKSLLSKSEITPMLAKKYEGGLLTSDVAITEKLDGNRCIALFNPSINRWQFTSRSGKPMNVDFDMTGMNTDYIYDGEVMSEAQTDLSRKRYEALLNDDEFVVDTKTSQLLFNETSGLINRHGPKKGLVYNVFDIVSKEPYYIRRNNLNIVEHTSDIRIVPVLYEGTNREHINNLLYKIVQMGGEGIMLNKDTRGYEHKRSDALLKYKQVQTMDLQVVSYYLGSGKYEGMIGGLRCKADLTNGKIVFVDVGSGLSDAQRLEWAMDPQKILGKIIEVGYHELTQDAANVGTNVYSLRFPRLLKVRNDKQSTSEF